MLANHWSTNKFFYGQYYNFKFYRIKKLDKIVTILWFKSLIVLTLSPSGSCHGFESLGHSDCLGISSQLLKKKINRNNFVSL